MSSSQTSTKRFELPALDLNFGSITDGTDIPPPPDSPVQKEPTPPRTPPKADAKLQSNGSEKATLPAAQASVKSNGNLAGTKRTADDAPLSPASSTRQGSLRRLFSRNMLNNSYAEGQVSSNGNGTGIGSAENKTTVAAAHVPRPPSQSGGSLLDERKSKRSSGWFRRLRTGDAASKRSSLVEELQPPQSPRQPAGPPPPMIPELKDLEKDDGSLGSDLFKNIN